MKVNYDQIVDAAFIWFSDKPSQHTQRINDFLNVDYAEDGTMVGIELLDVSRYANDTRVEVKYSVASASDKQDT